MAKRRLLQWMRDKLICHATETVRPVAEAKTLDAAYKKAAPIVRKIVQTKYKPADMVVCAKYDLTRPDQCIRLQLSTGAVQTFDFLPDDDVPIVPNGSCYSRMYLADEKATAAIEAWVDAAAAFKAEAQKRIAAYKALVQGSSTVEDVIEAWPEAAELIPAAHSVIALGPEQLAVLAADRKERLKEAA